MCGKNVCYCTLIMLEYIYIQINAIIVYLLLIK